MKHLFIILSILLLSSPLFGQPTGEHTLFLWETSSGIQWREFGEKDIHPQYKGDVENGKPNGLGVIINTNKGKYVGEWKDGKKQGQGTFTYGKLLLVFSGENLGKKIYTHNIKVILRMGNQMVWVLSLTLIKGSM